MPSTNINIDFQSLISNIMTSRNFDLWQHYYSWHQNAFNLQNINFDTINHNLITLQYIRGKIALMQMYPALLDWSVQYWYNSPKRSRIPNIIDTIKHNMPSPIQKPFQKILEYQHTKNFYICATTNLPNMYSPTALGGSSIYKIIQYLYYNHPDKNHNPYQLSDYLTRGELKHRLHQLHQTKNKDHSIKSAEKYIQLLLHVYQFEIFINKKLDQWYTSIHPNAKEHIQHINQYFKNLSKQRYHDIKIEFKIK